VTSSFIIIIIFHFIHFNISINHFNPPSVWLQAELAKRKAKGTEFAKEVSDQQKAFEKKESEWMRAKRKTEAEKNSGENSKKLKVHTEAAKA